MRLRKRRRCAGKRNLENDKELTVRTQITHVLNLAQEVNLKEEIRQLATDYQANRGLKFVYKKVGLSDTPDEDLLKHMDGALERRIDRVLRISGDF